MTESPFRDHDSGCLGELMARMTAASTKEFVGMSQRWNCCGCANVKFVKKVDHLMNVDKMCISIEESPASLAAYASNLQEGCFVIHLENSRKAIVVTTPAVMPDAVPVDAIDALKQCLVLIDAHGVRRMVINEYWKTEKETSDQIVRYLKCETPEESHELLTSIGLSRRYGYWDNNGLSMQEIVERLHEAIEQRDANDFTADVMNTPPSDRFP